MQKKNVILHVGTKVNTDLALFQTRRSVNVTRVKKCNLNFKAMTTEINYTFRVCETGRRSSAAPSSSFNNFTRSPSQPHIPFPTTYTGSVLPSSLHRTTCIRVDHNSARWWIPTSAFFSPYCFQLFLSALQSCSPLVDFLALAKRLPGTWNNNSGSPTPCQAVHCSYTYLVLVSFPSTDPGSTQMKYFRFRPNAETKRSGSHTGPQQQQQPEKRMVLVSDVRYFWRKEW